MVVIALQYDALNRSFTPLDNEGVELLEGGELFLVTISPSGLEADMQLVDLRSSKIAHA
jgi:hypothetical protein